MTSITSAELDMLLGQKTLAFINVDDLTLTKGILDLLDKDRFILNIHENILSAQNIESKDDFKEYLEIGFDLFQGYYIDKPEKMEIRGSKEPAQFIILQLIKIIKEDNTTNDKLEFFIKK